MNFKQVVVVATALFLPVCATADELPGNSVYQLSGEWQDQDSNTLTLSDLQGKRQLLAMVYTDCEHTCPVIVNNMKQIQKRVDDPGCKDTGYVLVSFTPETDTPEKLSEFSDQYDLGACWTLLRGDDRSVRQLAMTLAIKYTVGEGGYVAHSNLVSVLDERGRLLDQFSGMEKGIVPAAEAMSPE